MMLTENSDKLINNKYLSENNTQSYLLQLKKQILLINKPYNLSYCKGVKVCIYKVVSWTVSSKF